MKQFDARLKKLKSKLMKLTSVKRKTSKSKCLSKQSSSKDMDISVSNAGGGKMNLSDADVKVCLSKSNDEVGTYQASLEKIKTFNESDVSIVQTSEKSDRAFKHDENENGIDFKQENSKEVNNKEVVSGSSIGQAASEIVSDESKQEYSMMKTDQ